jgi:hypothetical protein
MAYGAQATCPLGLCGDATAKGLRLPTGLTLEEWLGAGRQLATIASASAWWVGDWLVYGERNYGRRYRAALELTSFDYKTLRNYAWVARSVAVSRRRDTLSFQHHAEVAALSEPEQDLWLARAQTMRWSRNELRRHLANAKRGAHAPSAAAGVVVRMVVQEPRERRWREAAACANRPLADWMAAVADQAAELALAQPGPSSPGSDARADGSPEGLLIDRVSSGSRSGAWRPPTPVA